MKVYHNISDFSTGKPTVITIGTFDGVHTGHRKIIEKLVQAAKTASRESLILTFFPHPRMVLGGNPPVKLLNTMEEKIALLDEAGIDNLVIHPFDAAFADLTPEEFVRRVLIEGLKVGRIIIGHDHRFGKNRAAGIDDLKLFGAEYGFDVEQIPAEEINDIAVSSTLIRKALDAGDVSLAARYLGYNYALTGEVAEGKKLGRTIGFPTANLRIADSHKQIPADGVYIVTAVVEHESMRGVMNIGSNPTVGGSSKSLEVHLFDFDRDIYGKRLTVTFLKRIREEQKFESVGELILQIARDASQARDFFDRR